MEDGFTLSLDAMRAWCDRNSIRYVNNDQLNQIAIPRPLQQGQWMVRLIPHEERKMLTFAFPIPMQVPRERVGVVSIALSLANSSSFMGAWTMHHGKGEVYFRVTLPTDGVEYSDEAIRFILQIVIGTTEGLANKIRAIALEGAPPQTILPQQAPAPEEA